MNSSNENSLDFTDAAWEALYDAVDDKDFHNQDANLIYHSLKQRLKFISFGEYLKRYIYKKAGLSGSYSEIPLKEYQLIIKESFLDNHTPASFIPTTTKLSALSKNWLTQHTVKRNIVFLLGFGLNMSVDDVNLFLTKALREPEINPKDPFEVMCWYCYKNGYNYIKYENLKSIYEQTPPNSLNIELLYGERTINIRNSMFSIQNDATLIAHLSKLKANISTSKISATAREHFNQLYDQSRDLIADLYNQTEDEKRNAYLIEYQKRLDQNDKLYDYEKRQRIEKIDNRRKFYQRQDITESDIEHIICSAIPIDRYGNLTPSKSSKLSAQFDGKRFSRQHIREILSANAEINRFDLITLNFFIFSQSINMYPNAKQRYVQFIESMNKILEECFMGKLYVQNPYECFILMCILSDDPLGTYADVWELSYEK